MKTLLRYSIRTSEVSLPYIVSIYRKQYIMGLVAYLMVLVFVTFIGYEIEKLVMGSYKDKKNGKG